MRQPLKSSKIQKSLECLLSQTAASRIDFILSADSPALLQEAERFLSPQARFAKSRFLLHRTPYLTRARVQSAAEATGDVVAFMEDHSFPEPNWAEEIIAAFESSEHIEAAAPVMVNPHPDSAVSRAQFLLFHGLHGMPERGRDPGRFEDTGALPWHNTAYRRHALIEAIGGDEDLFQTEGLLQERIRSSRSKVRFVICTRTTLEHVNMSRMAPALGHAFHGGRIYGSNVARQRQWGVAHKVVHFASFPALAVLKIVRWAPILNDRSSLQKTLSTFSVAGVVALAHAWGESMGACLGQGESLNAIMEFEYDRSRFLCPAERHLLMADAAPRQEDSAPGT